MPKGWEEVLLGDVVEVNPRRSFDLLAEDMVTVVPMAALDEKSGLIANPIIQPLQEVTRGLRQFEEGDVLFAKITPSMENGKSAIARNLVNSVGFGSTEFHVLRSKGAVLPEYLWRFIRRQDFRAAAKKVMSGAVGQQRVPAEFLKNSKLPLPPLEEQKRIVERLDTLIGHIDCAQLILKKISTLIANYRSSILEMAFTGRLTSDFRGDEPEYQDIPRTWTVRRLGDVSEIQGGIQVGRQRDAQSDLVEVPYLRVANVQRGWLDLGEVKTISVTPLELRRLTLKKGDVLMNEGGDRDKLGRGWVWDDQIENCIHQNHVFRIRLDAGVMSPEFLSHYANERGQQYFFEQGIQTTNLASVSKAKVAAFPVPVPPLLESLEIVRRIDDAFAWIDRVSADHQAALDLLPNLTASTLAKAFRGELVPQNEEDESAYDLLKRTRADWSTRNSSASTKRNVTKRGKSHHMATNRTLAEILAEASDWLPAQSAFQACGIGDGSTTEGIELVYAQLRELDLAGRLEFRVVTDQAGRKLYDCIKLKEL